MKYYDTLNSISKIAAIPNTCKDAEKLDHSYIAGDYVKRYDHTGKVWQCLKKLNTQLPHDPEIILLSFYPVKQRFMVTQKPAHAWLH